MSDAEEIAHAIAGAGGGALSMIVTYPLVTLSTLAQTTKKKKLQEKDRLNKKDKEGDDDDEDAKNDDEHKSEETDFEFNQLHVKLANSIIKSSSYQAAKEVIKEKGPLGLYSGLGSALYGITFTNFIYYYFYEFTSNFFLRSNLYNARKSKAGLSTFQSIITGAIAGAITCVGSNPFWVANTRMMTAKKDPSKKTSNSTIRIILDIIENDGIQSLFSGLLPALVLVINPIIQYTIFEQIKNAIIASNGKTSFTPYKAFFIGAFGKLIATSLTYPYITLKSRMHVKKQEIITKSETQESDINDIKLSMYQEIKKIIHEEGLEGLYRGLSVKLVQSISTAAFLFYFKEELLTGSVKLVSVFRLLNMKKVKGGK